MRFSKLASAINPLGYFERRFQRLDRKLDQRAASDEALASYLGRGLLQTPLGEQVALLNARIDALGEHQERMWGQFEFVRTRLNTYVGDDIAPAHAVDSMPIYVNAYDVGCPSALRNGGRYEEDNHQV